MDTFLETVKEDILIVADEPDDVAKYKEAWLYKQIGMSQANLHQQAASQHHLIFKSSADYTVSSEDVTNDRLLWPLPGNFRAFITLALVDSTQNVVTTTYSGATDIGQNGVTIVSPFEFELYPTPTEGTTMTLYYQRAAITDLFYGDTVTGSDKSQLKIKFADATGPINYTDSYYAGSYIRITSSTTTGIIGQIRKVSSTSSDGTYLTLTLTEDLSSDPADGSTFEILPEIPRRHWDVISWDVVRRMKSMSTDSKAVATCVLEYKEARHWYLQSMAVLKGRNGNQIIEEYPYSGDDSIWTEDDYWTL